MRSLAKLGALVALFLHLGAQAQTGSVSAASDFAFQRVMGNIYQGTLTGGTGGANGAWSVNAITGGNFSASKTGTLDLGMGRSAPVSSGFKLTPQAIAKGAMRGAVLGVGGLVVTTLLAEACVRLKSGNWNMNPDAALWEQCVTGQQEMPATWQDLAAPTEGTITGSADSVASAVIQKALSDFNTSCTRRNEQMGTFGVAGSGPYQGIAGSKTMTYEVSCNSGPWQPSGISGSAFAVCRNSNGVLIQATPGPNGPTCAGQATVGYSDADSAAVQAKVADKVEAWSQADFSYGRRTNSTGIEQAIAQGMTIEAPSKATQASGPAEVAGPTTTSTSTATNGDPLRTTTTTTNRLNYNTPSAGQVTHNTVTNTATVNVNSNVTINNTTTESEPTAEEKKTDPCEGNPGRVGCAELGTPETQNPTWSEKNIPLVPETLGLPAGCPAPVSLPIVGQFSYQPVCDLAGIGRALVYMGFLLAGIFLIVGAVRPS